MPQQREDLYSYFKKHTIPTESNFRDLIDSMLNLEDDGLFKPTGHPLSVKGIGGEEGLLNFCRDEGGINRTTWQFKQKPASATHAGLSIHDAVASNTPSRLFIESGTGNVGIGTTAPKHRLDVKGGIHVSDGVIQRGGTAITKTTDLGLYSHGDGSWLRFVSNNAPIRFFTDLGNDGIGGTARMSIEKGGNVGIGTTDPGQKLEVVGGNAVVNNVFLGDVGHGAGWAGFCHKNSVGSANYALIQSANGQNTLINKKPGSGFIGFRVGNVDKMVVLNSGNVGIGTRNPAGTLDVTNANGSFFRVINNAEGTGSLAGTRLVGAWDGAGKGAQVRFAGAGSGFIDIGQNAAGDFVVEGSDTPRLVVQNAGNVGIGTADPGDSKLRVAHSATDYANIHFTGSGMGRLDIGGWDKGWSINAKTDGKHLYLNRGAGSTSNVLVGRFGNELFVQGSNGNVGIGTTAPGSYKLNVSGATYFDGKVDVDGSSALSFGEQERQMINLWRTSYGIGIQSGTTYFRTAKNFAWYKGGTHNDSELNAGTGGTAQMVIKDGNVGIGTTNPGTSKLRVAHSATDYIDIYFSRSGMGQLQIVGWSSGWNINTKTNGKHLYINRDAGSNSNVLVGRNGKELFVQGSNGNVGIGTTNPGNYKLKVSGTTYLDGNVVVKPQLQIGDTIAHRGNYNFSSTALVVRSKTHNGGNSPEAAESVLALVREGVGGQAYSNMADFRLRRFENNGSNARTELSLFLTEGAFAPQQIMTFRSNGNVGIGTTAPGQKLEVAGVVRAKDGLLIDGNRSTHLTADGALYRYSGQVYIVVDDNFYIRDSSSTSPKFLFNTNNGQFQATGFIIGAGKSFRISHPTRPDYELTHACVEGPELAVYYRGEAQLVNGQTVITLPDYFNALTRPGTYTVQLTPKGSEPYLLSYSDFQTGAFHVHGTKPNGAFAWEVKAIRADIDPLEVETPVEEPEEALV